MKEKYIINKPEDFASLSTKIQEEILSYWNDAYYNKDNPEVSDELYDTCMAIYNKKTDKTIEYLGEVSVDFKQYEHKYPVLSLGKINKKEDFLQYVKKFSPEEKTDEWDYPIIEPKIDGLTVVYYPDGKLVSRGDGHVGEVLPWARLIPGLPIENTVSRPVRMEVYISKEDFKKYFASSNKNARNTVAGILRRKEYTNDIKRLSYVAYNILGSNEDEECQLIWLESLGFNVVPYKKINNDNKEEIFNTMEEWSKNLSYETDGVVIKANRFNANEVYGSTGHHPNNMIAYKFKSAVEKTILRSIEWSYGKNKVTPVAVFDPVELGGTTVNRASLHNLNIVRNLNIKIGKEVLVTKKNEIIPQIIYCDSDVPEEFKNVKCPKCGHKLKERDNGELYCPNIECSGQILEDAIRMSSKEGLDIKGLSEETWKAILKEKDEDFIPFMIISEAKHFLENPDKNRHYGLTPKMWTKICQAISLASENVPMDKFLVACNVPLLGRTASKEISKFCDYDMQNFWKLRTKFDTIDGIGKAICENINENILTISNCEQFVTFKKVEKEKTTPGYNVAYKIAITGTLSKPRSHFVQLIESKGWTVSSSISSNTHYLLCGENAGSKKDKANELGITILTEAEFNNMIKEAS